MEVYTGTIFHGDKYPQYRICVMSRLTDNTGLHPDPRITKDKYDIHLPQLAPRHVGAYYRGEITFEELMENYRSKLRSPKIRPLVEATAYVATRIPTIIMCAEFYAPKKKLICHRLRLAHELKMYQPSLRIIHLP